MLPPPGAPPHTCTPFTVTPAGCGVGQQSKVSAIEWTISYVDSVDVTEQNDFTFFLGGPGAPGGGNIVAPANGPFKFAIDISGGPQPYTAPAQVVFRIMDGAGNWSNWYTTNIP